MLRMAPELVLCIQAVVRTVAGSSPGVLVGHATLLLKTEKGDFCSLSL